MTTENLSERMEKQQMKDPSTVFKFRKREKRKTREKRER